MIGWIVVAAINLAIIAFVFRARRRPQPRKALGRLMYLCIGLFVALEVGGVIWGLGRMLAGVSTVDPTKKALVLAVGISETLNCMAFGFVVLFVPTLFAVVMFLRTPR